MRELDCTIQAILPELVELRHELHQHPEIRFEEVWTSDRVARFLDETGVPYTRGHAKGTGIVATLRGEGSRTVALRADMDALEIQEETGLPYASRIPNRMHACGHDGHTTCLLGTVRALARHREWLKGTVKFIFQPAEEQAAGGRFIVQEGVLDDVDGVFALHAWPAVPVGRIGLREGWFMASADWFEMVVRGKGCHGADPGSGVDPVVVAAHITTALQTIASREIDPWEPAVVTVAQINGGSATNIIPDTATLRGTYRSFKTEIHHTLRESIRRIAENTAAALRAGVEVAFGTEEVYPPLFNDIEMTGFVRETARRVFGQESVVDLPHPSMTAEDFAFYLERVPGAFICLGNNRTPERPSASLHNCRFDFSDDAIPIGVKLLSAIAIDFLGRE